jgi:hypothetical protein
MHMPLPRPSRPLVVELVGPAGVGKSTLARCLGAPGRGMRPGVSVWGLPVLLLAQTAATFLPRLLGLPRAVPWTARKQIIRLETLAYWVERQTARAADEVILLVEGPVFGLSWLRVFGHEATGGIPLARWRHAALTRWAGLLDLVVLLDAPDPLLAARIRTRQQPHMVKYGDDRTIADFAAQFRAAFRRVIGDLTERRGPRVITLATGDDPVLELAAKITAACAEARRSC